MVCDLCELATISTTNNEPDWLFGDKLPANTSYTIIQSCKSEKSKLQREVSAGGLTHRQPPKPADGNCLFHATSDQIKCPNMPEQKAAQLCKAAVEYLRTRPTRCRWGSSQRVSLSSSPLGHLSEDVHTTDPEDWIVLWGLVNMSSVEVALVSSLGQNALRIISPDSSNKSQDIGSMALLGHKAEHLFLQGVLKVL